MHGFPIEGVGQAVVYCSSPLYPKELYRLSKYRGQIEMVQAKKNFSTNLKLSKVVLKNSFTFIVTCTQKHEKNSVSAIAHLWATPKHDPPIDPTTLILLKYDFPSSVSHEFGPKYYEKI